MKDASHTKQIDEIIKLYGGWRGKTISRLRTIIKEADPEATEEVKWKMPSKPEGIPVWYHDGIMCMVETFKNDVKLVFFKGTDMKDSHKLFNARLKSKTERAIEFQEGDTINETAIKALVREAARLNSGQDSKD